MWSHLARVPSLAMRAPRIVPLARPAAAPAMQLRFTAPTATCTATTTMRATMGHPRFSSHSSHSRSGYSGRSSHSSSSSSSSSTASSRFASRVWARFVDFLRSPLVHNGGKLIIIVGGGAAIYHAATGAHQREFLDHAFPERVAQREADLYASRSGYQYSGVLLDPSSQRRNSGMPTVLMGIIGINVVVFLVHQLPAPAVQQFMQRHFFTSFLHVAKGRMYHTLITSVFSHASTLHLAANMFTLANLAPAVIYLIGEREFLQFYLLCGVVSSIAEAFCGSLFRRADWRMVAHRIPSLGASGSLLGVVGLLWAFFPDNRYGLLLIPYYVRMDQLAPVIGAFDACGFGYKLINGPHAGLSLGHMAHFSGLMFGYAYANTYLRARVPAAKYKLDYNERVKRIGV